jgi:hypothetical protein
MHLLQQQKYQDVPPCLNGIVENLYKIDLFNRSGKSCVPKLYSFAKCFPDQASGRSWLNSGMKELALHYCHQTFVVVNSCYEQIILNRFNLRDGVYLVGQFRDPIHLLRKEDEASFYISLLYRDIDEYEGAPVWPKVRNFLKVLSETRSPPMFVYLRPANISDNKSLIHLNTLNYRKSLASQKEIEQKYIQEIGCYPCSVNDEAGNRYFVSQNYLDFVRSKETYTPRSKRFMGFLNK